jgi:hypothetical protein
MFPGILVNPILPLPPPPSYGLRSWIPGTKASCRLYKSNYENFLTWGWVGGLATLLQNVAYKKQWEIVF